MKLTAFILLLSCLITGLQGKAQTVTLTVKDAKLESVLKQIKKQTGYSFFVDEPTLGKAAKVSFDLKNATFEETLAACFNQQPALIYSIVGKTVVVSEKPPGLIVTPVTGNGSTLPAESSTIKGFVYNNRLEPLANASVMVRGSQKGTTTNVNGEFVLQGGKKGDVLRVSYIGYKTQDIVYDGSQQQLIRLEEASNELDQVVAQGYSKTTRRLSTSSVARVSREEIERQPVMNPLMALQSKVPGMLVTPASGYAAAPVEIVIRGKSLMSAASPNPLIIIDGTPLNTGSNQGVLTGDGPVQGWMAAMNPAGSQSQLFGINPRDIESIEVLKDLGATAIYGSSGANGVILITTKRAKSGSSDLSVNIEYGIQKVLRYWELLDTKQYLEMRREAYKNDGLTPRVYDAPDLLLWDTTRYTNWQKEVWGNTGNRMIASVAYSGGAQQVRARLAANYIGEKPITRVTGNNLVTGITMAVDFNSLNQKFRATATASYNYSKLNMVNMPIMAYLPPNAPPLLDEAGDINFKGWGSSNPSIIISTGIQSLLKPIESQTNGLNANFNLNYLLAKGLSLITNLGYVRMENDAFSFTPIRSQNPAMNPTGSTVYTNSKSNSFTVEPQVSYDTWIGRGRLGVVAGLTYKNEKRQSISNMALGFTNDAMLRSISSAPFSYSANTLQPYKYFGVFGRVEYVWDNKYVMNVLGRRDGSSRFGPGNRFGNFGSVGLAWIASEEEWLRDIVSPVVNLLKFNANIGTAGADGGSDYQFLTQWGRDALVNYGGEAPALSQHAVNPDYHWQSAKELNIGMEIGLLKDSRLALGLNYYRRRMGDQLRNNSTPIYTGFKDVYGNWNAVVQNEGFEATVSMQLIRKKDFNWTVSVNGGFNKDKLVAYPAIENSPDYSTYLVGQSIQYRYLLHYIGVDPLTGNYQFQDYNHDGVINYTAQYNLPPGSFPSDAQYKILTMPKLAGGISQYFRYKNMSLNMQFAYRFQDGLNVYRSIPTPGALGNIPVEVYNNRWRQPGDNAKFARLSTLDVQEFARTQSSLSYTDASYLRLQNISFSWSATEKLAKKMGMKGWSMGINAQNIFVITDYEGIDPDVQNFNTMPPAKTIVLTLSLTL